MLNWGWNRPFFVSCNLQIRWMNLKNNRAPLLYYIKLCASFQIHRCIETEVTVRKRSIRVIISDFLSCVTLKFDGWHWKTIGHLFYATSSFVQHFVPIGEFKLELQSGNAQFGSKSAIFCPVWPWNLTDGLEQGKSEGFDSCDRPIIFRRVTLKFDRSRKIIRRDFYTTSSFVYHFISISEFKLELQSGNAQSGSN